MSIVSPRSVLITGIGGVAALTGAGAAYGLVEEDVLPGRYRLAPYLGKCGSMPPLPKVVPGAVEQVAFRPAAGRGTARVLIGYPADVTRNLPAVVGAHDGPAVAARAHDQDLSCEHPQTLPGVAEPFAHTR